MGAEANTSASLSDHLRRHQQLQLSTKAKLYVKEKVTAFSSTEAHRDEDSLQGIWKRPTLFKQVLY